MLIASFISWWWLGGVRQLWHRLLNKLDATRDYFSIGLLLRTLFQPFRMIDAGTVDGPLEMKIRAAIDRLVSRLIGGLIRLTLMLIGLVAIFLQIIFSLFYMLFWIVLPILPAVGVVLFILGIAPAWLK